LFKEVEFNEENFYVFAEIFESDLLIMVLISNKISIKSKIWLSFEKCRNIFE
jgi:hypothetical protein